MKSQEYKMPFPAVDLKQALTDLIESIAMEEKACGRILSAESELLESAKKSAADIDEFEELHSSVENVVRSIATLQHFCQYEMEDSGNLLKKLADISEFNELEE